MANTDDLEGINERLTKMEDIIRRALKETDILSALTAEDITEEILEEIRRRISFIQDVLESADII